MNIELVGILKWIFTICVTATSVVIIITGTWIICNYIIWEVIIRSGLKFLKLYKVFVHFIYYRKRFEKWFNKYEGKYEPMANDDE
jgi:hypothetical protein